MRRFQKNNPDKSTYSMSSDASKRKSRFSSLRPGKNKEKTRQTKFGSKVNTGGVLRFGETGSDSPIQRGNLQPTFPKTATKNQEKLKFDFGKKTQRNRYDSEGSYSDDEIAKTDRIVAQRKAAKNQKRTPSSSTKQNERNSSISQRNSSVKKPNPHFTAVRTHNESTDTLPGANPRSQSYGQKQYKQYSFDDYKQRKTRATRNNNSVNRYEGIQSPRRLSVDQSINYKTQENHISLNPNLSLELNLKKSRTQMMESPPPLPPMDFSTPPPTPAEAEKHATPVNSRLKRFNDSNRSSNTRSSSAYSLFKPGNRNTAKSPDVSSYSSNIRKTSQKKKSWFRSSKKKQKPEYEFVSPSQPEREAMGEDDETFVDYTVIPLLLRADLSYNIADNFGRILKEKYSSSQVRKLMQNPFELFGALEQEGFRVDDKVKFNIVDDEFWKLGSESPGGKRRTSFVFYKNKTNLETPVAKTKQADLRTSFKKTKQSFTKNHFKQEKIYKAGDEVPIDHNKFQENLRKFSQLGAGHPSL
eukprot:augustus_masked-scaffold_24-processed-gene-3.47-mRNA-1 protein AED:0.14 eAED:1.00 QI:0/-1/0/1/-1/1/1/0/526